MVSKKRHLPETGTTWVVKKSHDTERYQHEWAIAAPGAVSLDESVGDGPVVLVVMWACNCGAMKEVEYLTQKPSRTWYRKQEEVDGA